MGQRNMDRDINVIVSEASKWGGEFAQLAASFGAGISPDKGRARKVGEAMSQQGAKLKAVLDELEHSRDFQAMENYHVMDRMARRRGAPSLRTVEQLVNWQASGLQAFAESRPLAPLPPGVDPAALARVAPGPGQASPTDRITMEFFPPAVLPFDADSFDSVPGQDAQFLKASFERLSKEHRDLVGLGENYGDFDTAGKEFYLGQLGQIAFRWEELMDGAILAGIRPSAAYRQMSQEKLQKAQITADDFRQLIDDVHDLFRDQVDREKATGR